jgi:hypothetical protein
MLMLIKIYDLRMSDHEYLSRKRKFFQDLENLHINAFNNVPLLVVMEPDSFCSCGELFLRSRAHSRAMEASTGAFQAYPSGGD